jgi:hypothetical protein
MAARIQGWNGVVPMSDQTKPNAETPSKLIGLVDKWESLETDCPALQPRVDAKHECAKELKAALAAETPKPETQVMTDGQIKYMVNRFLGWRLPENFNPDAGISFKPTFNEHTPHPMKSEPTGTNLFDAAQAEEMIRYLVERMPPKPETQAGTMGAKQFASEIWHTCVIGCPHNGTYPCNETHGHGLELDESKLADMILARDARRDADAQKLGKTVALQIASQHVPWEHGMCSCGKRAWPKGSDPFEGWKQHVLSLASSDGQSLVDKHDAEIRAEALREAIDSLKAALPSLRVPDGTIAKTMHACIERLEALIAAQPEKP